MVLADSLPPPILWLIGGTGEAIVLAQRLSAGGIPCLVTVTTEAARHRYEPNSHLWVRVGPLEPRHLVTFIQTQGIGAIVDASHPFAADISRAAIAAATALGLPYWRYERPPATTAQGSTDLVKRYPSLEAMLEQGILDRQRVLLTLGYRWLEAFRPWQQRATLFARILPSPVALAAALGAGFTSDRLWAIRPPVSAALEAALWDQWQITTVVCKASGEAGGEATKQVVAEQLGVRLVIIERPLIPYPAVSHRLDHTLAFCQQWWQSQSSSANF
ncbi:MAG TPA: cobalt-precorrin-6A reductase [Leptolyngbyaceae cyanobacterium M65_K2018_010]|nr:cobalt-precorrin-6A reductase [Leptolyngbyaceae cyanobacterium M65_K2018_010]